MAFDLNMALKNENYAYNAWIHATQLGNTAKISPGDLEVLEKKYSNELAGWLERYQEYDATEYDVPDFDLSNYDDAYADGAAAGDKGAAFDWQSAGSVAGSAANILTGELMQNAAQNAAKAASEAFTKSMHKSIQSSMGGGSIFDIKGPGEVNDIVGRSNFTSQNLAGDTTLLEESTCIDYAQAPDTTLAEQSEVDQKKNADKSWMIQAPLSAAIAVLYWATRPNIKEAEALKELGNIMEEGSGQIQDSVARMIELSAGAAEAAALAGQASADFAEFMKVLEEGMGSKQEQLNAALLEKEKLEQAIKDAEKGLKPLQDDIKEKLAIVEQKIANGEQPTPEEQAQIATLKAQLAGLNAPIDGLLADLATLNGVIEGLQADIAADLESIAGQKDVGAAVAAEHNATIVANNEEMVVHGQNIAYQQGVVASAESQDKGVMASIGLEILSQAGNVYSGIKAGIAAARNVPLFGWWAGVCAALGFAGAAGSTGAVVDQGIALANVAKEMGQRNDLTDNLGVATEQFETSTGQNLESLDTGILSENTIIEYEVEDTGETA